MVVLLVMTGCRLFHIFMVLGKKDVSPTKRRAPAGFSSNYRSTRKIINTHHITMNLDNCEVSAPFQNKCVLSLKTESGGAEIV